MKVCDKTCIFFFFPIINKYFLMAKRSLLSRCPSYVQTPLPAQIWDARVISTADCSVWFPCISTQMSTEHANRCSELSIFAYWFTSTVRRCAFSITTTHVVHEGMKEHRTATAWTRLSADSGLDVGAQSGGLHDHLTSVVWIFGCGDTWWLRYIQSRSVTLRWYSKQRMPVERCG